MHALTSVNETPPDGSGWHPPVECFGVAKAVGFPRKGSRRTISFVPL